MTAIGESCRRRGHHLPAVYDPTRTPTVRRSMIVGGVGKERSSSHATASRSRQSFVAYRNQLNKRHGRRRQRLRPSA
jgi:hypothetical protein